MHTLLTSTRCHRRGCTTHGLLVALHGILGRLLSCLAGWEEARRAWAQLKRVTNGQAWMKFVSHQALDAMRASGLAQHGKQGTHVYAESVT
jgi:hypothetical protein